MKQIKSLKDDQDLNDHRIKQEKLAMEMLRLSQKITELIKALDDQLEFIYKELFKMIKRIIDLELDPILDKEIIEFLNDLPFDQVQNEMKKAILEGIKIDMKKETNLT